MLYNNAVDYSDCSNNGHQAMNMQSVPTCMNKPVSNHIQAGQHNHVQAGQLDHVQACQHEKSSCTFLHVYGLLS